MVILEDIMSEWIDRCYLRMGRCTHSGGCIADPGLSLGGRFGPDRVLSGESIPILP
jgi:hypothetical protein